MRAFRSLLTFKLGFWAGLMTAAAVMRRAVPSRGDEESDELALVAIMNGIELKSRATAFTGGSMLAWFGGIAVDLRDAELAEGARIDVRTLFGGIAIRIPATWRVEAKVKAFAGGIETSTPAQDDPDAPVLRLEGEALFGGIAVGAKAPAASSHESLRDQKTY
jgi:Cell wall-active antibiotics response 4TMS YvqF